MLSTKGYRRKIEAAWKLQGKTKWQGLPVCIENKKGSVRSGKEPHGKPWSVKMPYDYGYIDGTAGADGDGVDVFIGPNAKAEFVYIVHQKKIDKPKEYDEDKVMLNFATADAAKRAYHSAYNNADLFHSMTCLPVKEFIQKLKSHYGKKIHAAIMAGGPGSGRRNQFVWECDHCGTGMYTKDISRNKSNETHCKECGKEKGTTFRDQEREDEERYGKKMKAGGEGSGRKKVNDVASILRKPWKKQTDEERITVARNDKRQMSLPLHSDAAKEEGEQIEKTIGKGKDSVGQLAGGGPGSGRHPYGRQSKEAKLAVRRAKQMEERRARNAQGLSQRGKPILSLKAKRALASASPAGKEVQDIAEKNESSMAKAIAAMKSRNNSPFDLTVKDSKGRWHGIEAKALLYQKNNKITQKGDAIARKERYASKNGIKFMHTVAVDYRSSMSNPTVYHRSGVGSFRIGSMEKVSGGFKGLKAHLGL